MQPVIEIAVYIDELNNEQKVKIIEDTLFVQRPGELLQPHSMPLSFELEDGTELHVISPDELLIPESGCRLIRKK
ncbi:hypothetical protein [Advenella sp. FME57]|uniref:hypothetical protein n=1 Tax=Advenella sp. FME57 TaxID=2742604 RepID=UPI001867836C|nr:hypothetical protein [Advenella sp. FME57]